MTDSADFPYPIPEDGAEPYWSACNEERLVMQRCSECKRFRWTPSPWCIFCQSPAFKWEPLSGMGTIYTWTVVTHPVHPAAAERVPYVVAEIELDEQTGLRMVSNVVDCEPDEIAFDAPVKVKFTTQSNGQRLPVFRLA